MKNTLFCKPQSVAICGDDGHLIDVLIMPDGQVESEKGSFLVDAEAWMEVEKTYRAMGVDLVIDYEHQTMGGEYASPDGTAPAAGWIKSLRYEPGRGIVAQVQWTPRARDLIRAQEYRYLSPVMGIRNDDHRVVSLLHAGLVNAPAIHDMEAVAAKNVSRKESFAMAEEPAATTMGASPESIVGEIIGISQIQVEDGADIIAKLVAIRDWVKKNKGDPAEGEESAEEAENAEVASSARKALGLKEDAGAAELTVAINSLKSGSDSVSELKKQVDTLSLSIKTRDANDLLAPHIEAQRINPNDKEDVQFCVELAMKDADRFAHQMSKRQPYVPPGRTVAPSRRTGGNSRETVISNATRMHGECDPKIRIATVDAFVNNALREAGMKTLGDDEKEALIII